MPEEQKEAIRNTLQRKKPSIERMKRFVSTCKREECSNLMDYNRTNKTFCSPECLSTVRRHKRIEHLASIEEDFRKAYLEDRLSCSELEEMFSLKQRSIYYLIEDFDLPTFSQR